MNSKSQHGYSLIELIVDDGYGRYFSCDSSARLE